MDNAEDKKIKKIFTINKSDGTSEEVEEVICFQFDDTKKKYIVYTKNEIDETGNVTIYVTEVINNGDGPKFVGVESEEEWNKIKDVLRELAKNDGK